MIQVFTYNNTFEGFLTVVFECYRRDSYPVDICPKEKLQGNLFGEHIYIESNSKKAQRVWAGLQKKLAGNKKDLPFYSYLSELEGIEMKIFRFIRRVFSEQFNVETDYGDRDVLFLIQVSQKVKREGMRIIQFVRFQRTRDGLYFCGIEPQYDVIPLVINHYKKRFADQKWIIYDLKRDYGIYYDLISTQEINFTEKEFSEIDGVVHDNILEEGEEVYQNLWKIYFKSINIKERKNLRLQRQHMPQRFWEFLPEKQP